MVDVWVLEEVNVRDECRSCSFVLFPTEQAAMTKLLEIARTGLQNYPDFILERELADITKNKRFACVMKWQNVVYNVYKYDAKLEDSRETGCGCDECLKLINDMYNAWRFSTTDHKTFILIDNGKNIASYTIGDEEEEFYELYAKYRLCDSNNVH